MKKIFKFKNIQAILLAILSVAEMILMLLYKPLPVGYIWLWEVFMLLFIAEVRFAYELSFLSNRWHSMWNRKYSSEEDDEPSAVAVGISKAVGYFFLLFAQVILFL